LTKAQQQMQYSIKIHKACHMLLGNRRNKPVQLLSLHRLYLVDNDQYPRNLSLLS